MTVLKKGDGWGVSIVVRLPCGHAQEVLREIAEDGRIKDRCGCTICRRVFEGLVLEGWVS